MPNQSLIGKLFCLETVKEKHITMDVNAPWHLIKSNFTICASWGTRQPVNMDNYALKFEVNGFNHKGWVYVMLHWTDTYSLFFVNQDGILTKEDYNVYCDELVDRIDTVVEKQPHYKK